MRDALLASRLSRCLFVIALSEAGLASGAAVEVLVLKVVLGSAVASRRAAAVEVTVGSCTRAAHATLGVTANVNLRDAVGESLGGRAAVALGRGTREVLQASLGVAVVVGSSAPAVLGA